MLAACEASQVFALLEGGGSRSHDAAEAIFTLFTTVRDPCVTRQLMYYYARTGSIRALELLARAPDPHFKHMFDILQEQLLRSDRVIRHHAFSVLAPLIALRPTWLHHLPEHPVVRDMLRVARHECEAVPLMHALLAFATLIPSVPKFVSMYPTELTDLILRPSLLDTPPSPLARHHLLFAQRALFRTLYATHPCTVVDALMRSHATEHGPVARDRWERAVASLAESVRLHPGLITGTRLREAEPTRWAGLEMHDIVDEYRRFAVLPLNDITPSPPVVQVPISSSAPLFGGAYSPAPGSGGHAARSASALRPGAESWFPLIERCGAESAPATPLPDDIDSAEPLETAVEATPENTPARDTSTQFRFPGESGTVRAIGRWSRGGSPPGEVHSTRLARVQLERRAADSPVSFAGAPPPAVPRPEPSRLHPVEEPFNIEDREVLELTHRTTARDHWSMTDNRQSLTLKAHQQPEPLTRPSRAFSSSSAPRRSASCGRECGSRRCEAAVQTVDVWPGPYEFLITAFQSASIEDPSSKMEKCTPNERLEDYLTDLYAGLCGAETADIVSLLKTQLMYEQWRRDVYAERNRRLFGRCRETHALELLNQTLTNRVQQLTRECDELRASNVPTRPVEPAPPAADEALRAVTAELTVERAARFRAEAMLHEAKAARANDSTELHRQRAESYETARHVETLSRVAVTAERRADHVRRLRRELLVLSERETRLAAAVRAAPPPKQNPVDDRAYRAAFARAEAETNAAMLRAEAATARAHELEAMLAARDAALMEMKRTLRLSADESAARLKAVNDKYTAMKRIMCARESRRLEWLAEIEMSAGGYVGIGPPEDVEAGADAGAECS